MTRRRGALAIAAAATAALAGCGSFAPAGGASPTAAHRPLPPAAEPATAPAPTAPPAGQLLALPGGEPEGIVADPTTGDVAVALRHPDRLAIVDGRTLRLLRVVAVPGAARHLALAAPGGPVLLPGEDTDLLVAVALPGGAVVGKTKVGRQPHDAVATNGAIFVADEFGHDLSVIRDGRVVATLPGPVQPGGVAATAGRVGAVDVRGALVYVYDASTGRRVGTVRVGAGPSHDVTIAPGLVAVADTRGNAVYVVAFGATPRVVGHIAAPGSPYGLAADPARHRLWVTLTGRNQVVGFAVGPDGSLREFARVSTVRQPNSVTVNPITGQVYVAGLTDAQLQSIRA